MRTTTHTSNEIGIEFKVWAPTFNRVTHRLYLLGSLKELGAWNIEDALRALPAPDLHIWSVQAAVPAQSRFEWVWLKINIKTKKVEWERPVKRNRTVTYFSAVLHTVWAEHEEVFLQYAANVELTTFKTVNKGHVLVLTGSSITLGAWNMQKALHACEFPKHSGYWKVSFSFDARKNLEFKWAVVKERDVNNVQEQEKVSHNLYGRHTWMRVAAPFMTTSTVVVEVLPLDHLLDNMMGRTDIIVRERKRRLIEIRQWLISSRDSGNLPRAPLLVGRNAVPNRVPIPGLRPPSRSASISTSLSSQPSMADVDLKSRSESVNNVEILTRQLNKDFLQSSDLHVFAIKGAGQEEVPTDLINIDISNQVPLVECGMVLLTAAKGAQPHQQQQEQQQYDYEADVAATIAQASTTPRSRVTPSRSTIDTTHFYPLDGRKGPDQLHAFFREVDRKFDEFSKQNNFHEGDGVPEYEAFVDRVEPSTPLTFSMLSERDIERSKNPTLAEPLKKQSRKDAFATYKAVKIASPAKMSLSETFKKMDQQEILTEAAATARGYFSLQRNSSVASIRDVPATLGRDDISKSVQDLNEETNNRMRWDITRDSDPELGLQTLNDQESVSPSPSSIIDPRPRAAKKK